MLVPKDTEELSLMVDYAMAIGKPVAIRYPNGVCPTFETKTHFSADNLWEEYIASDSDYCIMACGPRTIDIALKVAKDIPATVINARSVKPLDTAVLDKYADKMIITVEDNTEIGGFGSMITYYYQNKGVKADVSVIGVKDKFVEHASVSSQLNKNGITKERITAILSAEKR